MKNKKKVIPIILVIVFLITYSLIKHSKVKEQKELFIQRNCPNTEINPFFNDTRFYDPCGDVINQHKIENNFFTKNTNLSFFDDYYIVYCTRFNPFPLGDGDMDCITKIRKGDINYLLQQEPWKGVNWKKGKITEVSHHFDDGKINNFDNEIGDIYNTESIYYAIKDRSPEGNKLINYDLIVLDPEKQVLFMIKYDS